MNVSLTALEFQRLKALLLRYVSTGAARQLLDEELEPTTRLDELEVEHALVFEAMACLREQRVPFNDVPSLELAIGKLAVAGSALEITEIEAVQSLLHQIEGLRVRWKDEAEAFPKLAQKASRLPDLHELSRHLARAVHDGEVDERYSPQLARIRRALETTRSRLTSRLESMLRSPDLADYVQDQLVTVRNGRFVIPVRTDQKRGVEGIVHGTSSSGATVFMEPLAVLELNNELVRLRDQEFAEIVRILAELTDLIQQNGPQVLTARRLVAELELTFAKARFGREFDCCRPVFSNGGLLSLIHARHPLLEDNLKSQGRTIAPVSLDLDSTRRVLVISGPNAGGKTVVLKTAGLLALMAQSGLPVPAGEATFPVFDQILADIGDQQSITNHLSTFSAHVLSIRSMLESVTSRSLILLDEIGSSTEPGEGAALAKAVLEQFRRAGCLVIATTHYNRLKIYAETTPGVSNAAMEFNETTLEPTYRLLHGLAGASSGLKIAERLKMPQPVLADAVAFLEAGEADVALYVEELRRRISDLEREKSALEKERREFEADRERELEALRRQHSLELARAEHRVQEITKEMSERATRELGAVQEESLRKYQRRLDNVKARAVAQIRQEKERVVPKSPGESGGGSPPRETRSPPLEVGAKVRIQSLGVTGSIANVHGGEAEVLVGNIRMRRPLDDLEGLEKPGELKLPANVHLSVSSQPVESNEINLLGTRVDEALSRTDKFLDDAFLAQMSQVRIVHGTGTGALKNAIAELLKSHPHVARFESAPHNEGGRGVTLVTLRD